MGNVLPIKYNLFGLINGLVLLLSPWPKLIVLLNWLLIIKWLSMVKQAFLYTFGLFVHLILLIGWMMTKIISKCKKLLSELFYQLLVYCLRHIVKHLCCIELNSILLKVLLLQPTSNQFLFFLISLSLQWIFYT